MRTVSQFQCDIAEHKAWFDMIQDKENWKKPIHAIVPQRHFEQFRLATVFYTGGDLAIKEEYGNGLVQVYGEGYYSHCGS